MINRQILKYFQELIDSTESDKPVYLVEGARQTGKTTAIKMALGLRNYLYIDFEKEKIFREKTDQCREFKEWEILLKDTYGFTPSQEKILVIDEAQESSKLGSFVRYMKEDWPAQTTILLGSLMSRLFRDGVREPIGRIRRVTVYPFSFKEFLIAWEKKDLVLAIEQWSPEQPFPLHRHELLMDFLQKYLETGGLPKVVDIRVHSSEEATFSWRDQLHQLKIQYEEDFARIYGVEKLSLFQRILKRTAETVGYPSKRTAIVSSSQREYQFLDDMLSQIERWRLIHRVPQESYEPTRNSRLHPKLYLFDTGMCQLLGGASRPFPDLVNPLPPEARTPLGGLLENYALCEIFHLQPESVNGWRYKTNGSEIDFIVKKGGSTFPLEIKSSLKFRIDFLSPVINYLRLYDLKKGFLADLTPGGAHIIDGKQILRIPLYCISELMRF